MRETPQNHWIARMKDTMIGRRKAQGNVRALCAQAYPHAVASGHSHKSILEEDVDFVHDLVIAMDISNHTVPGHSLLESGAARRKLIDTRGADGIVSPIEGDKVGPHSDGANTLGRLAAPDSVLELTDLARWAAGWVA